jgi:Ras-related protein Rab-24
MSAGKVDLKVVLLGKEYGGKTSLVERYVHGKFTESAPYQAVSFPGINREPYCV